MTDIGVGAFDTDLSAHAIAPAYGDTCYSNLFGRCDNEAGYLRKNPCIEAFLEGDYDTALRLADELKNVAGAMLALEIIGLLAVYDDDRLAEYYDRRRRCVAMIPATLIERHWLEATIVLHNRAETFKETSEYVNSSLITARDNAYNAGVLDVAWYLHERLLTQAYLAGDLKGLRSLVSELQDELSGDAQVVWRALTFVCWVARDRGDEPTIALKENLAAFDAMLTALAESRIRKVWMIETLAATAAALSDADTLANADDIAELVERFDWHQSLDEWHGRARTLLARVLARHGRVDQAMTLIDNGLRVIDLPFARIMLMNLQGQIADVTGKVHILKDAASELSGLVDRIDWQHRTTSRSDLLELLSAAGTIALVDEERGVKVRQLYDDVSDHIEDAPVVRLSTRRHRLLEQSCSAIVDVALDGGMKATASLQSAVTAWESEGTLWRAAELAYYLAKYTSDRTHVKAACDFLRPWPESPYRKSLERLRLVKDGE